MSWRCESCGQKIKGKEKYCPECAAKTVCLDYIYEHDKYKAAVGRGETVTRFSSKKYARREAKAQRKRQNKRLDYLFKVIEGQNTGLKNISYC